MNNKVFYQHPNLMRALGMHETVMEVMVNVLGGGGDSKVSTVSFPPKSPLRCIDVFIAQVGERLSSKVNVFFKTDREVGLLTRQPGLHFIPQEIRFPQMVTNCCRFLCYFCRISRQNQRSMFDHLGYLLQNSGIGLGQCNAFIRFDKIENGNLGRPLPSRAQLQKCGSGMYSKLVKR